MTIPLWARALILAALVAAIGFAIDHLDNSRQQIGYDRAQAEYTANAEKQRTTNQDTARAVEVRYVDREVVRLEYITKIEKELQHETQNLAACTVTDGAVRLLNDARDCASQDRPTPCGAGEQVRNP